MGRDPCIWKNSMVYLMKELVALLMRASQACVTVRLAVVFWSYRNENLNFVRPIIR